MRASETPVLDQFDGPGRGYGLNGLFRLPLEAGASLEVGLDLRRMDGQTNELFRNLGAGFSRQRRAGGEQFLAGGFVELTSKPTPRLSLSAAFRLDYWKVSDGQRLERDLATGAIVRQDVIADRDGWVAKGRLAARYEIDQQSALSLSYLLSKNVRLSAAGRWVGEAFDDDLNSRLLEDFVVLDLRLDFDLSQTLGIFLAAENLLDHRVPSALSADGLVTLATPRLVSGGLRVGF